MNTEIAKTVAITCHGNAFLKGKNPPELTLNNSALQFCDRVSFSRTKKSLVGIITSVEVAGSPQEWFSHIASNGSTGIHLARIPQNFPDAPDRTTAGFANGGGIWVMEVVGKDCQGELWAPSSEVWDRNAPGRRIWRVAYNQLLMPNDEFPVEKDIHSITTDLLAILERIHKLAEKGEFVSFAGRFKNAMDTLESEGKHLYGYHTDLVPQGMISKQAATILDACQSAWVFGAMGSWNDITLPGDDQQEYDIVSEKLFTTICDAICAAVNESYRSR